MPGTASRSGNVILAIRDAILRTSPAGTTPAMVGDRTRRVDATPRKFFAALPTALFALPEAAQASASAAAVPDVAITSDTFAG